MKNYTLRRLFGKRLEKLRKSRNLSQKQLAEMLGYKSAAAVSHIERGQNAPDFEKMVLISILLKADLHMLVFGMPSPESAELVIELRPLVEERLKDISGRISTLEKTASQVEVEELFDGQSATDRTRELREEHDKLRQSYNRILELMRRILGAYASDQDIASLPRSK